MKGLATSMLVILLACCFSAGSLQAQTKRYSGSTTVSAEGDRGTASFEEISRRADDARQAGKLDDAIGLYKQAVQLKPSWAEGWWYLATIFYDSDRYSEGRDAFRRFVAVEPKNGPGWALLGLCEFQLKDYPRSLLDIQHGRDLGLNGNEQLTFVVRYHAALLLTRFEQYEAAQQILYYYARTLPKENPLIMEALGISVLRLPLLPSEVAPEKRELITRAGTAAYHDGAKRLDEARQEFEEFVALYPNTPNVHYIYGVFLLEDRPEAAIEEFRKELKLSPNHVPARLQIAFADINNHQFAAGLSFAEEAVKLDPQSFPARNALGRILLERGDIERAIKELEIGTKLAPESPEMYFALAKAYARAGREADAAKARENFVRLDKVRRARQERPEAAGAEQKIEGNTTPK